MKTLACLLAVIAAPLRGETCPAAPDIRVEEAQIFAQIQTAPDEAMARGYTNALWALWTKAPDQAAQEVLDDGMTRRSSYDFLAAEAAFDRLIAYCPEYAEGYNQRAFVRFLREEHAAALPDLDRALSINPNHVAALAGKAMTLMALGREDEAQEVLRMALKLHPWLPERAFLRKVPGTDL